MSSQINIPTACAQNNTRDIMKTLAIFDLDGTLLNTIADLAAATNFSLEQMGFPTHSVSSYTNMVGNGVTKLLERALPDDSRTNRVIEAMRRHFTEYYDAHCCDDTTVYPGIAELLNELNNRNVSLAVTSNKYQSAVTRLISHFFPNNEWVAVLGHHDGVPVKPDPSIVFEVLSQHPTPKEQVLYIGDSGVDMETARRACVESAGVTWGFRPRLELVQTYADHIISNPDDILSLI